VIRTGVVNELHGIEPGRVLNSVGLEALPCDVSPKYISFK